VGRGRFPLPFGAFARKPITREQPMKASLLSACALAAGLGLLAILVPSRAAPGGKDGKLTELASDGWATLSGRVTYDGTPPAPKKIDMKNNKDNAACHKGATEKELVEQTWLVSKENKGVANVVIFLKPPEGKFFKIHPSYMEQASKGPVVTLDQPHCAFLPHVSVYWASYYDKDNGEQKPSGVKFRVLNNAKFTHNTSWSCDEDYNTKGSLTIAPGSAKDLRFNADPNTPLSFKCDIHPWMNAKCWSLDTPYAARTDDNGRFSIANVPAGAELRVIAWHEGVGFVYGKAGKAMTFEDEKEHRLNLKIKAR
jgi:hypothetical protein